MLFRSRLYRNEDEIGFNGFKNSDSEYVTAELRAETEFKVKPFKKEEGGGRNFLASSPVVKVNENRFESVSIYKSYNYNNFLSWGFIGDADGFLVFTQNLDKPIYETTDKLCITCLCMITKGLQNFMCRLLLILLTGV